MTRTQIQLPDELYERAKRFGSARELSLAEMTRRGLEMFLARFPELAHHPLAVGIWGRKAGPLEVLRDNDRLEIYRPLTVDPKVARRERFRKQGSRATGLFASRRPGAKPGY